MNDNEIQTIIDTIIKRGNDVQIQRYKGGYKIFEVKKRLIATVQTTDNGNTETPQ